MTYYGVFLNIFIYKNNDDNLKMTNRAIDSADSAP